MKKYLKISMIYAVAAMIGGVFYREFTKFYQYTGVTALGKVHTHLFILGMIVFLIVALYAKNMKLEEQKTFKPFMILYNIGLAGMAVMLVVRGVPQVMGIALSSAISAMISGIAGLAHICLGAGIVLLIITFQKCAE
jgi:phosphatidylglycerophosphate synthase